MRSGKEAELTQNKPKPKKVSKKTVKQDEFPQQELKVYNTPNSLCKVEAEEVDVTDYTVEADLQDLNDKIKSMMMFSENHAGGSHGRARVCKVCGKEGIMGNIKNHIEANHISHTCEICGTVARSRNALATHRSSNHRGN